MTVNVLFEFPECPRVVCGSFPREYVYSPVTGGALKITGFVEMELQSFPGLGE
jgi:hypothetical protein